MLQADPSKVSVKAKKQGLPQVSSIVRCLLLSMVEFLLKVYFIQLLDYIIFFSNLQFQIKKLMEEPIYNLYPKLYTQKPGKTDDRPVFSWFCFLSSIKYN